MDRPPQFLKVTHLETLGVLIGAGTSEYVKTLLGSPSWIVFLFVAAPISTLAIYGGIPKLAARHTGFSKTLADFVHWIVGVQSGLAAGVMFSGILAGTTSFLLVPVFGVGLFFGIVLVNWKRKEWVS